MNIDALEIWLRHMEPMLPLVAGIVSVTVLLGCAVASWLCPSAREDCLFHRHVM